MNKSAVVLAADSAVTVGTHPTERVIYNTANKLFSLSKYDPVGIMVSHQADIMGIPWEIIIKQFRQELGKKHLGTLDEYTHRFFCFLRSVPVEDKAEDMYCRQTCSSVTNTIYNCFSDIIQNDNGYDTHKKQQLLASLVAKAHSQSVSLLSDEFTDDDKKALQTKWDVLLTTFVGVLNKKTGIALIPDSVAQLKESVINVLCSSVPRTDIVIAGFGKDEYYARCRCFDVGAIIQKNIAYKLVRSDDISVEKSAAIIPLAQQAVIRSFLDGISTDLWRILVDGLKKVVGGEGYLLNKLTELITSTVTVEDSQKMFLLSQLSSVCEGYLKEMIRGLSDERWQIHTRPIVETVQYLNKDELVQMAETLVSLESFRKKITSAPETVGVPIDIAVITKGDGFIWSKRKHYFQPELNHQFFKNYFNENDTP